MNRTLLKEKDNKKGGEAIHLLGAKTKNEHLSSG